MRHGTIMVAMTSDGIIGRDGTMPWHISEELKLFKRTTLGGIILMGRKTAESLGMKPLKKRENVVISRSVDSIDGFEVFPSLKEAFLHYQQDERPLFFCGGKMIYKEALQLASHLHISYIKQSYEGDCCFPEINWLEWREVSKEEHEDFVHVKYIYKS